MNRGTLFSALVVVVLFEATMLTGLFIPAFSDDILLPITSARAGYDGWQMISLFPQCGASFTTPIPLTLLPGRAISWLIHTQVNGFYALRATAIFILAAWMGYTAWFLKRSIVPGQPFLYILAALVGFCGLGVLPFSLLLSRPETALVFAVTFYLSLPFLVKTYPELSGGKTAMGAILFFVVTSWFVSAHPKALFYTPLFLVSAVSFCAWHKNIGRALVGVSAFTCYQAWWDHWRFKLTCPGSAGVRYHWANEALSPALLTHNAARFWHQLARNIGHMFDYVNGILFLDRRWLPVALHTGLEPFVNRMIITVILGVAAGAIAGTAAMFYYAWRNRTWKHPAVLISPCLFAGVAAQMAIQSSKIFYNSILVWMTVVWCAAMAGIYLSHYAYVKKTWLGYACCTVSAVAILSQCVLLLTYVPATVSALQNATLNGEVRSGWKLISPMGYEERQQRILDTANMCRIAPDESSRHVAVDIFTYLAFKNTYQPFHLVFKFHEFREPENLFSFLRQSQSSGLVTLCDFLPKNIAALATQHEGVCCISREQIKIR